jgi:hypothetical protein
MSAATAKPPREPKVAREVAEAEFARMCDAYRIEHDAAEMPKDELEEWNNLRNGIVRDMMSGAIVVGADGNPTYTAPEAGGAVSITFHPPTGATLLALETYPGGKQIANMLAAMADMTRTDRGEFGKMPSRDVHACSRLAKLFLADR